jgi:GAF domain-containing protein
VIGALTVQSSQPHAFDAAALQVLQTMADQLATAIQNALLFARSQEALEAERRAYAQSGQVEWEQWRAVMDPGARRNLSLRSDIHGGLQATDDWYPEMQQAYASQNTIVRDARLAIPIRVRGQVIGVISASAAENSVAGTAGSAGWVGDEITFLESIAEQLGVALDAARLYAETRKRAEQERLVDELTGRMRATLDIQSVLETAAREMRDALGLAEVEVRLGEPQPPTPHSSGNGGHQA